MSKGYAMLNDAALASNGGSIIFATDDFFAVAENLLRTEDPEWYEGVYTEFGKKMDGWETRRKRKAGHDFAILSLAENTVIQGIEVNTRYFIGNHAPSVSIQASKELSSSLKKRTRQSQIGTEATEKDIADVNVATQNWTTILGTVNLNYGYPETARNSFKIDNTKTWKYLRLNLYPDGGIARLRVFGNIIAPDNVDSICDLAAFQNGGECFSYSDAHFGHPKNLIRPYKGTSMADGWETARRLDRPRILKEGKNGELNYSGQEWCIIKLGLAGTVRRLVIDTNHFKGNYPDSVKVEVTDDVTVEENTMWFPILSFTKVWPNMEHEYVINNNILSRYVRLTIKPDGGISRLRVFGKPNTYQN